jgi:hypothetical protein
MVAVWWPQGAHRNGVFVPNYRLNTPEHHWNTIEAPMVPQDHPSEYPTSFHSSNTLWHHWPWSYTRCFEGCFVVFEGDCVGSFLPSVPRDSDPSTSYAIHWLSDALPQIGPDRPGWGRVISFLIAGDHHILDNLSKSYLLILLPDIFHGKCLAFFHFLWKCACNLISIIGKNTVPVTRIFSKAANGESPLPPYTHPGRSQNTSW